MRTKLLSKMLWGALAASTCLAPAAMADTGPHVLWLPGHGPARTAPHDRATGQMNYYGGPVISTVKVVSVMWNSQVNSTVQAQIGGFFTAATNSTFFDIMAQYATDLTGINGHAGTDQTISRGTWNEQVVLVPHNGATTLTDKQVQKELLYQIKHKKLPKPDANTLYMTYFPPGYTILLGKAASCSAFGAYHEGFMNKAHGGIFYGVMPDCGYSFNDETIVSSHELAEATTDAFPTPGSKPNYPQAWNTSDGYEIGDLCEGLSGNLVAGSTTYQVQQIYSNAIASCTSGNYHSP
jgi:hypothetical protein